MRNLTISGNSIAKNSRSTGNLILLQYNTLLVENKTLADLEGLSLLKEIILVIVVLTVLSIFFIKWTTKVVYGKYAKKIRQILDELNEDC